MGSRGTQGMRAPQRQAFGAASPGTSPGMHRFVWDMRVAGAGGRGGPMALPGDYQIRLSVGEWSETRSFKVRVDPRVEADGVRFADLQAQFDFNMKVGALSQETNAFAAALDDAIGSGEYGGRKLGQLNELQALMVDAGGSYPQPMFLGQLRYLQGMTSRADQRPGNFAYTRFDELSQKLAEIKARFQQVAGGDE